MRKRPFLYALILAALLFASGYAEALCVNVPEANLRSGPGTKYEKRWLVFKYTALKRLSRKGGWYKVKDVDGDVHWINAKLVTSRFNCAVVKVRRANVRSGPGTRYRKTALSPAIKYDAFKVIKRKGAWVKVMDEFGEKGWIYRKLLWIQ